MELKFQKFLRAQGMNPTQSLLTKKRILSGVTFGVNLGRFLLDRSLTGEDFIEVIAFLKDNNMMRTMMKPGSTYVRGISSIVANRPFAGAVLKTINDFVGSEEDSDTPGVRTPEEESAESENVSEGNPSEGTHPESESGKGKEKMTEEDIQREEAEAIKRRAEQLRREAEEEADEARRRRETTEQARAAANAEMEHQRLVKEQLDRMKADEAAKKAKISEEARRILEQVRTQREARERFEAWEASEATRRANDLFRAQKAREKANQEKAEAEMKRKAEEQRQNEERDQKEMEAKRDAKEALREEYLRHHVAEHIRSIMNAHTYVAIPTLESYRVAAVTCLSQLIGAESAKFSAQYSDPLFEIRKLRAEIRIYQKLIDDQKARQSSSS